MSTGGTDSGGIIFDGRDDKIVEVEVGHLLRNISWLTFQPGRDVSALEQYILLVIVEWRSMAGNLICLKPGGGSHYRILQRIRDSLPRNRMRIYYGLRMTLDWCPPNPKDDRIAQYALSAGLSCKLLLALIAVSLLSH